MGSRGDVRTIRGIMTPDPVTVRSNTTILRLRQLFEVHDFNMFPVVDDHGVLRGVVTKLDVLKMYRPWSGRVTVNVRALWAEHVEDIMSRGLTSVTPEEPVRTALTLMVNCRVRSIPVVQRQTRQPLLVGIVSRNDVLRSLPLGDSPGPT
jgi:acetoin utilization protein AcuB